MYCPNCGFKNEEEDCFCSECGTSLSSSSISQNFKVTEKTNYILKDEINNSFKKNDSSTSKKEISLSTFSNLEEEKLPKKVISFWIGGISIILIGLIGFSFGIYYSRNNDLFSNQAIALNSSSPKKISDLSSQSISSISAQKSTQVKMSSSLNSSELFRTSKVDSSLASYITSYVMKIRAQPSYEGERIGRKEKGEILNIVRIESSTNDSFWGELVEGGWVCLRDADLVYCEEIYNTSNS